MSWFTTTRVAKERRPQLEANNKDETPARAITKLALSRQVDALNTSERPPTPSKERKGAL